MKLSVLANLYGKKSLEETLQILTGLGVHTVEIGAGGYPGKAHCNPAELLADEKKYDAFMATLKKYDVTVCALAAHGNALHPNPEIAKQFDTDFRNAFTHFSIAGFSNQSLVFFQNQTAITQSCNYFFHSGTKPQGKACMRHHGTIIPPHGKLCRVSRHSIPNC